MNEAILVINAGSSSIKFAVFVKAGNDEPSLRAKGQVEGLGSDPSFAVKDAAGAVIDERDEWPRGSTFGHVDAIRYILTYLEEQFPDMRLMAAGHRVVHGGLKYPKPVLVTPAVLADLAELVPLAPLHQPHNLAGIRAVTEVNAAMPQVACFDTAFHRTQPPVAQMFAIPLALTDGGIRRYGFHGLSYEYIAHRLATVVPDAKRVVVAHLGSGASMCALHGGVSMESTMGFTAVDGLPMGTRTGALDPGVVLYLMQERGYDAKAIEKLLYKESGLLGMSGVSNDMRDLEASSDPHAAEAIDVFVYAIVKNVGALAAVLGGLDALVFTAGIGEHAPAIRARVCNAVAWLGLDFDADANHTNGPCLTKPGSRVSAWVIPTDEERMIATHTQHCLPATATATAPAA